MTAIRRFLYRARWPLAVLAGTLVLTRLLTAPGVQPADSGEFQLVARELGIAHPPGYALYTMAAHAWGWAATIPAVGRALGANPALWTAARPFYADPWTWAINAFSALLAVLTLALVYRTAYLLTGARAGGFAAALALALAPTFMIQGAIANIRMPTAFFTALLIYLACRWLADDAARPVAVAPPSPDWRLAGLALAAGLAAGHHGSLAFIALLASIVVLTRRPRVVLDWRTLAAVLGALALSLAPQVYLPVRDFQGALFAEGHLRTLAGVVNHVTAADFRGDAFYFHDLDTALDRAAVIWNAVGLNVSLSTLAVAVLGLLHLARSRPRESLLLGLVTASIVVLTLTYRAPQTLEYLMPVYVVAAIAFGVAIGALCLGRRWLALTLGVLVLCSLPSFVPALESRRDAIPRATYIAAALDAANLPGKGTILASWHFATPLWYAAKYLVPRPDVTINYVYPEGAESIGATWLRRLRETQSPVLLTNRTQELIAAEVPLWPARGSDFYLNQPPSGGHDLRPAQPPVTFGDRIRLDAYTPTDARYGSPTILASLAAVRPVTETLTVTARLVDPDTGTVWGQVDRTIPASRWNDPRGVVVALELPRFQGDTPTKGEYQLGVYRTTPAGPQSLAVGARSSFRIGGFDVPPAADDTLARAFPPTLHSSGLAVPFGDAMTLSSSSVHRDGDQLIVDLTWRADADAAASDYTVSVQAHGDGWSAQDDGTPALGAIPTLKWLPGMVIHDRHRLQLPAGLPLDAPFRVTVGVYDAFSLEPLPVTDAERVRQGQGQAAEVYRQGESP